MNRKVYRGVIEQEQEKFYDLFSNNVDLLRER